MSTTTNVFPKKIMSLGAADLVLREESLQGFGKSPWTDASFLPQHTLNLNYSVESCSHFNHVGGTNRSTSGEHRQVQ